MIAIATQPTTALSAFPRCEGVQVHGRLITRMKRNVLCQLTTVMSNSQSGNDGRVRERALCVRFSAY